MIAVQTHTHITHKHNYIYFSCFPSARVLARLLNNIFLCTHKHFSLHIYTNQFPLFPCKWERERVYVLVKLSKAFVWFSFFFCFYHPRVPFVLRPCDKCHTGVGKYNCTYWHIHFRLYFDMLYTCKQGGFERNKCWKMWL